VVRTRKRETGSCQPAGGDVYHGAFLNGILRNLSVKESAKIASAAGALNAMKIGGRGNLVNHDRLNIFLREAKEIQPKP
jgi:sugar/nucleoside kinase (ribokinase family)